KVASLNFDNTVKLQSWTVFDGTADQLQDKSYSFKDGALFDATLSDSYAAGVVATTTDYNYGGSIYLQNTATARGKVASLNFDNNVEEQRGGEFDGTAEQLQDKR